MNLYKFYHKLNDKQKDIFKDALQNMLDESYVEDDFPIITEVINKLWTDDLCCHLDIINLVNSMDVRCKLCKNKNGFSEDAYCFDQETCEHYKSNLDAKNEATDNSDIIITEDVVDAKTLTQAKEELEKTGWTLDEHGHFNKTEFAFFYREDITITLILNGEKVIRSYKYERDTVK
ncbi:MAG: hypothetical protein C0594_15360 [Marinilabiliales bacterium]|nr:MAG: hypothetical protein C0594_15360 [Marinilabiliales bacterium]